ncbi:hypothetical protein AMJ52_01365 [candidate division TA06 bacterium DG_78]|uniref:DUF763 domain-containing protein n=1 Tax=candidate division TA06 bacterium DG_78 TaxID=1703772 RepID=A0A0S7YHL6_UNCT6|nr:MAG: hypothetical protein AMJ52_01365 [candidate division TA06 bacterium DG_78]
MRTGIANLPLHHGRAPRWLFEKMVKLSAALIEAIVIAKGRKEFLCRISDPFWFQACGAVLGFDWHSSGVTTTVCGAMKEGIKNISKDLGLYICGGKGATSRKTPQEIAKQSERLSIDSEHLIYSSRISAKVDNTCVQDGYNLYHHVFIFTKEGDWSVIQQGMNTENRFARRYHWLSSRLQSYICEPHTAVCCDDRHPSLNMVASESETSRTIVTELSREKPDKVIKEAKRILNMPARHPVLRFDINPRYFHRVLLKTYERSAEDFQTLIGVNGVGPKTIRALALIGELLHGATPSFEDPARYSFAHGGKDGFPYPVNRDTYNQSITFLKSAINRTKLGNSDKLQALKRLSSI